MSYNRRVNRKRLLKHTNVCMHCGKEVTLSTSTIEHIIPRALGGPNSFHNYGLACTDCNGCRWKGTKNPLDIENKPTYEDVCLTIWKLIGRIPLNLTNVPKERHPFVIHGYWLKIQAFTKVFETSKQRLIQEGLYNDT